MIYTNAPLSVSHRNLTYSRVTAGISVESLSLLCTHSRIKKAKTGGTLLSR